MDKTRLILEKLLTQDYTINQIIRLIWLDDLAKGGPDGIVEIGPFKWVHLNKAFDPLKEKKKYIEHNGTFKREGKRDEKVWTITAKGKAALAGLEDGEGLYKRTFKAVGKVIATNA